MNEKQHSLYRIWYQDNLVYLGRTNQKLQNRLRGHFFGAPMHRKLELNHVSKIEYAIFETEADMYVYEVYFINLYKPLLNRDDLSYSELTISLPDVEWIEYNSPRLSNWKEEITRRDEKYKQHQKEAAELFQRSCEERRDNPDLCFELREKYKELVNRKW